MSPWSAAHLAQQLMALHGLTAWRFAFNHRKRSMGLCRFEQRAIELSWHFVMRNDEAEVRDTILHEIAHALAGPEAGHGPGWKRICQSIGATPQRCGVADMPRGTWRAVCPTCSREHSRHRRPDLGRRYYCRACGPESGQLRFEARHVTPSVV